MRSVKLFVCALFLFITTALAESHGRYFSVVRDVNGVVISSATITVYQAGTNTLAVIHSDAAGAPKGNPFLSDPLGNYSFYAVPGIYKVVATKIGVGTFTLDQIPIGTQPHAERHASLGPDPLILAGISGTLPDAQKNRVLHNGAPIGIQAGINFVDSGRLESSVDDDTGRVNLSFDLIPDSITASYLAPDSVGASELAPGAVGGENVSPSAGIQESKLALNFPTHSNVHDPSAAEKGALIGSFGTPGPANPYVTEADPRNTNQRIPTIHATSHGAAGSDPITVSSSQISDLNSLETEAHHTEHEDEGNDEISIQGLSGLLLDPQKVQVQRGGATVGVRKIINFREGGNTLLTIQDDAANDRLNVQVDAIIPGTADASATVKGVVRLSLDPATSSNPIAVGDNDPRMVDPRPPSGPAGGVLSGSFPNPAIGSGVITDAMLVESYSGTGACGANAWVSTLNDHASPTCSQPSFTSLSGSATDAQVTDALTISGGAISTSSMTLVQSASPAPTAEGRVEWDTDDNRFVVGDGATSKIFYPGAHAGASVEGGSATTAAAAASTPTLCSAGQAARGVDASFNATGCFAGANSFATISTASGTSPVASSTTDTLTLAAGTGMSVTGDSGTKTVTLAVGSLDASTITSGTLGSARLPAATTSAQGAVTLSANRETTTGEAVAANDIRVARPWQRFTLYDDFYYTSTNDASGAMGRLGWIINGNVGMQGPELGRPTIMRISSPTPDTTGNSTYLQSGIKALDVDLIGWLVRTAPPATGVRVMLGFGADCTDSTHLGANAVFFALDSVARGNSNWWLEVWEGNSLTSRADTGVAASTSSFQRLEIDRGIAPGDWSWTINGTHVNGDGITASGPSVTVFPCALVKETSGANRAVDLSGFWLESVAL